MEGFMEWWWWIIPAAVGVFGLAFVLSGLGWMFRGKPFKGGRGVVTGGALLAIGAVVSLLGLNVQTYNRLSHERPVARVSLAAVEGQARTFTATVTELGEDGLPLGTPQTYTLEGDQWQMDARVITWKPWANVLGLDSQYELQRIWGRNVTQGPTATAEGQAMTVAREGLDFLALMDSLPRWLSTVAPAQEREFGSAVFMPMANGSEYEVRMTQEGLAVDPGNEFTRGLIQGGQLRMVVPPTPEPVPAPAP
jgi:hypothetical protein